MAPPQIALSHHQPAFPQLCPVTDAVASMSSAGIEERGAIYTRREVVEFVVEDDEGKKKTIETRSIDHLNNLHDLQSQGFELFYISGL